MNRMRIIGSHMNFATSRLDAAPGVKMAGSCHTPSSMGAFGRRHAIPCPRSLHDTAPISAYGFHAQPSYLTEVL